MKKRQKVFLIILIILIVVAIADFMLRGRQQDRSGLITSTKEQQYYLQHQIDGARKIIIKVGWETPKIIEVTDEAIIHKIVTTLSFEQHEPVCKCLGPYTITFELQDGTLVWANYNPTDPYVKYDNPWDYQGIPSQQFEQLFACLIKEMLPNNLL
ncbi:MAG: hypothetical protein QME42_03620 [bacterium]|nr:hypothetical protein [bacterium]